WALFQVDAYVLPTGEVELKPSENIICSYMQKITDYWDEYVRNFHNYLNDETLQIFVQPTIMGKQMEWTAGESPNLYFLMNQDKSLLNDIQLISLVNHDAYDKVWIFLGRMKRFMDNFREAHEIDVNIIKNERDVNAFRKLCTELAKQMDEIEEVVSFQPLGLIFLNLCPFQELFRPQPRKLFEVVNSTTPE
ncbi:jg216, partial [Pararge aegeria aegeria]